MKKLYHIIFVSVVSVFLFSGIVYAANTIISVQPQSIANGDTIAVWWYQDINDTTLVSKNTLPVLTGVINTLSGRVSTLESSLWWNISNQWSNYPNNTLPTGIYYPIGNVGIWTLPETSVKLKIDWVTVTNSNIEFTNSAWLRKDAWFGLENWMDGKTRTHIWGFIDTDGIRRVWLYADQTYISGNMWIWTYNPADKLHIQFNSSSAWIVMTNLANSVWSRWFRVSNDNNRFNIQKTYDDWTFQSNLLNILTSWYIWIWTVNPQRIVDINSDSSWHSMRITRDAESHWTDFVQRPTSYGAPNAFSIYNYNRGNYYHGITINQDGNVWIGTETPSQKLEVTGNVTANDYYIATAGKWASQIWWGRSSGVNIYQCPSWTNGWNPGGAWASYWCQWQISSSSTCSNIEYPNTQTRNCTYIWILTIQ